MNSHPFLTILISIIWIRSILVLIYRTKANNLVEEYMSEYFNYMKSLPYSDNDDWFIFYKRLQQMPTFIEMFFSFHKWTFKNLTNDLKAELEVAFSSIKENYQQNLRQKN